MGIADHELVSLSRSAAMAPPHSKVGVDRNDLIDLVEEVTANRRLLRRLGGDLKAVARQAPRQ